MRHQKFGKKLNRDIKERKSLFKSLVNSLILYGRITTSVAKAKAVRGLVDKLVNKSKEGTLSARRQVAGFLNRADVVRRLVDVIAPKFKERSGGFTRIIKKDERAGDSSPQAVMEWVEKIEEKSVKEVKTPTGIKKTAPDKEKPKNK